MKRCSIDGSDDRGGYGVVAQKSKMQRSIRGGVEKVAELGEDLALAQAGGFWGGRRPCAGSGVSWRRTSAWEAMCTRDWVKVPCGIQQLRAVVLALGGFRRLHSLYTLPFLSSSSRRPGAAPLPLSLTSAAAAPSTMTWRPHLQPRWGKDEREVMAFAAAELDSSALEDE
ncbi:F-box domain [Musa troglodytarum]|uniref:F-box domain n=1 Tax=Musa troglodytarum TaxID=320322 RepID=A0A9E7JB86_9LILI|nr:F-box domain [Musa troglodytarum]